ncbi:MAG: hypothetical protein ACYDA4_15800 [Ignavibacteriaceae bacterium]
MKDLKYMTYLIVVVVLCMVSCSNKKEELSKLMQERNYSRARGLLKTFSAEELNSPEVLLYKDTLKFIEIDSMVSFYSSRNSYLSIDSILNIYIDLITNSIKLKDSLLSLKEFYAFKGAQYYSSIGSNYKAFQILKKYLSKQYFTEEQSQIINQVLKDKINGIWKGENFSSKKILIAMQLNALTSRSFEGILDFKGQPWISYQRLLIENGVFDGYQLSAQAFIMRFDTRGNIYNGDQSTLLGSVNNDTLHLTIDLNSYLIPAGSTEWILTRK